MLNRRNPRDPGQRRGVILMVVLCLLTLFAIVGIAFVFYADAEATAARVAREAETLSAYGSVAWNTSGGGPGGGVGPGGPGGGGPGGGGGGPGGNGTADLDPYSALPLILGPLIYDAPDTGVNPGSGQPVSGGVYNPLRGQSLSRSSYSYNSSQTYPNDKAFTGTGRPHGQSPFFGQAGSGFAADDAYLPVYTYYPNDKFLRDPERLSTRANLSAPQNAFTGGSNVPYTYPDHQNFWLAMQRPTDGMVLVPSFHRPWLFGNLGDPNNPNWTNAWGKYLTPRYRPAEMGPGFPMPSDAGGDVKNITWAPGGNDSIWIDPGAPIMTTSSGLQFKMLVAPLILDLGNRLDLNVHGNILAQLNGQNNLHAGNQGGYPTEVNLTQVFNATVGNANEVPNLFLGAGTNQGRYGANGLPNGPTPNTGPSPHLYAATDFNGTVDPAPNTPSSAPLFAGQGTSPANPVYSPFPLFPASFGYGNGGGSELNNAGGQLIHPLAYSAQFPQGDDLAFPITSMVALLRSSGQAGYTPPGAALPTSALLSLCPNSFNNLKLRNLCGVNNTFTLDRPAMTPYVWDPADSVNNPTTRYQYTSAANPPPPMTGAQPIAYPTPGAGAPPTFSDFDISWRGIPRATRILPNPSPGPGYQTLLGRLDLNRYLTPFPFPYPGVGRFSNTSQVSQAIADRQQFALDLFTALLKATGALDPASVRTNANLGVNSPEYAALRWLAQLAVNIVDYIDQDDYNTPFQWDPGATPPQWVFGTELPRLLINEVYVQLDNDPNDQGISNPGTGKKPTATTAYNVNITAELVNPHINEGTNYDNTAVLQDSTGNIYQLVLTDPGMATTPSPTLPNIRNLANATGDPDFGLPSGTTNVVSKITSWGTTGTQMTVAPLNGAYSGTAGKNQGFYVIAPPAGNYFTPPNTTTSTAPTNITPTSTPGSSPNTTGPNLNSPVGNSMTYQIPAMNNPNPKPQPTLLLQRLAIPGLPPNPLVNGVPQNTSLPPNPYITVDYVESRNANGKLMFYDARKYDSGGNNPPTTLGNGPEASWGRSQPYAAYYYQLNQQTPAGVTAGGTTVAHTFFRHNAVENTAPSASTAGQTLRVPFDWLVHLDRQPISPMELWHVSFYKPHELTQQFFSGQANTPFTPTTPAVCGQMTPWQDQTNRLYRVFEMLETSSRAAYVNQYGRIPGKININNIWDLEVGRALVDPQPGDLFTQAQVDAVITAMIQQRSPTGAPAITANGPPNGFPVNQMPGMPVTIPNVVAGDQPFWSLAMGYASGNDAMDPAFIQTITTPPPAYNPRGINNTLLRTNPSTGMMLFDPNPPNSSGFVPPYQRMQILTKLFNNVTTTSNVFAVWLTVGFFQVTNASTAPVQLGAEITSNGQHIRHQMFCIVDRSQLQTFSTTSTAGVTASATPQLINININTSQTIAGPPAQYFVTDGRTGRNWQVTQDTLLTFEPNTPNEETVSVQADPTSGALTATFTRNHANGCQVINRGNPGPISSYNQASDRLVVPYYTVIY